MEGKQTSYVIRFLWPNSPWGLLAWGLFFLSGMGLVISTGGLKLGQDGLVFLLGGVALAYLLPSMRKFYENKKTKFKG